MELKKELEVLKSYMGGKNPDKFKSHFDFIHQHFTSEADLTEIDRFLESELKMIGNQVEQRISESEIRLKLMEVKEIVSLSYIAKTYFNRTRSWLHQKINGNLKNGKPCAFSSAELITFNHALQDISKKIGSIAIYP
ncbi:MAG: DUF5053 domain-containing protein [Tannerella sp.]|jgi:hypothetical protein|nr:DUF5053 domain-containing protein [Tannerella sp.]